MHMEKEILLRINLAKVNFTYVEETIAQYFTDGRKPLTIHELCKKIGLNNFKELMYLYEQHLNMQNAPQISNISLDLQSEYFRIFHLVDQNFDAKAMEQVCRYIYEHRIINIFAFGLSATAAEDFRFRFSRLGKFIEVIHDKDAIKMSSRVLQKQDLVFIFTLRGNTYLEELAAELTLRGILVVSILGNQNSRLKKLSDVVLYTSSLYYHYVRTYSDALTNWASTEEILKDRKE